MEIGKVELSIERYEVLRAIERGETIKIKALEEELQKAKDDRLVMKKVISKYNWGNEQSSTEYSYITKDEVVQSLNDTLSKKEQLIARFDTRLAVISKKPFAERLKYLFTKELSV